jgi:ABC-2 type transport system permease protein
MEPVWIVVQKEIMQAARSRMTLFTILLTTLLLTALPVGLAYGMGPGGLLTNLPQRQGDTETQKLIAGAFPQLAGLAQPQQVQGLILGGLQAMFLIIPLMIPMIIAVYSVIGEKQTRSLEALLATPIETDQLLAGKCIAAALPGILSGWISYALFATLSWPATRGPVFDQIVMRPGWLIALVLLVPGAAFLAVVLALIVSSRATDPQSAQQVAGLIVLPVVGLMVGQLSGVVQISPLLSVILGAALLAIDAGLLAVAVRLFQRETILTRWK